MCYAKGLKLDFQTQDICSKPLAYKNLSCGLQFPFLETDNNNGPSMTFIFKVIDAADWKEESWYPAYPMAAAWSTEAPQEVLQNLKGIGTVVGYTQ